MATEPDVDTELLLTDPIEGEDSDAPREPIDDGDEFPDTFDDDADPEQETPLIKQLREQRKQDAIEKRELNRRLAEAEKRNVPVSKPKPDLWEDCEGDPDKFEAALLAWKDNEREAERHANAASAPKLEEAQQWANELQSYRVKAASLAKPDFAAAEAAVVEDFTDAQQRAIVKAAKEPHKFIYALGRSPLRRAQLAQIHDDIKLAAEVARIEGGRTMARKEPANIDTPLRGNARLSSAPKNETEDKLIAKAQRTGDATELRAYRREQRGKAA